MDYETDQRPASRGHVFKLLRTAVEGLTDATRDALGLHGKKLAALEQRIAELESRQLRYVGTFETGRKYVPGEMATDRGSVWHCDSPTTTRPGDSDCWTLCVKSGRDGRDAPTRRER